MPCSSARSCSSRPRRRGSPSDSRRSLPAFRPPSRWHPPRRPPCSPRGAASGTTGARSPSSRRRRSSRATGGHATWPACRSCPGSAHTPRAPSPRSRSANPVGVVDTNVRRWLLRRFGGPDEPRRLQGLSDALAAPGQGADVAAWTHASMEFGAAICRSRDPRCDTCPIARGCPSRGAAASGRRRSPAGSARLRPRLSRRGAAPAVGRGRPCAGGSEAAGGPGARRATHRSCP